MNEKMHEVMIVGGDMKEAMAKDVANHMRANLDSLMKHKYVIVVDSTPPTDLTFEARKIAGLVKVAAPGGNRRQRRERN